MAPSHHLIQGRVLCYCKAPRESWQAAACILGKDLRDLLETESPEFQTAGGDTFSHCSPWTSLMGNAGYSPKASKRIWRAWDWQGKAERDGLIRNIFETSDPKGCPCHTASMDTAGPRDGS